MTRATQSAQMLVEPLDADGIAAQVRIFQSGRSTFATVQVLCLGLRVAFHQRIRPVAIFRAIEALNNLREGCHGAFATEKYGPETQRLCTAATLTPQAGHCTSEAHGRSQMAHSPPVADDFGGCDCGLGSGGGAGLQARLGLARGGPPDDPCTELTCWPCGRCISPK